MEKEKAFFDCEKFLNRKGLSRKGLAKMLEFKESTVGNWCTNTSTPNYATIAKLIEFGITAQELFGEELASELVKNSSGALPPQDILNNAVFRGGMEDIVLEVLKAKGVIPK